jgi:hypothetical protein
MAVLAVSLACGLARTLSAQGTVIDLVVVDSATRAPLPGVRVSIMGTAGESTTDANGRFLHPHARVGRLSFLLRHLGYAPKALHLDVGAGDTTHILFALAPAPTNLAPVTVRDSMASNSTSLAGFERRVANRVGSASYVTRAEIEKRRPIATTDLLRRIASIRIVDSAGMDIAISARMQKVMSRATPAGHSFYLAECALQVAVDGYFREWGFNVNSIPPEQIHGIEVYPGAATIPAEFSGVRRDAYCGAILIWTRIDK